MSGFDNGTLQGGIFDQVKRFGSVLRGSGPPVPQAGVVGDLYFDQVSNQLFNKRSTDAGADVDPWGHYLFQVPATYQATLKWFGTAPPDATIGINGDYFMLWGGYPNYGIGTLSIYGPKAAGAWPANPTNVPVNVNPLFTAQDSHGV